MASGIDTARPGTEASTVRARRTGTRRRSGAAAGSRDRRCGLRAAVGLAVRGAGPGSPAQIVPQVAIARILVVTAVVVARRSRRANVAAERAARLVELIKMRGHTLCPNSVDVFLDLWRQGEIRRIDEETSSESSELAPRRFHAA